LAGDHQLTLFEGVPQMLERLQGAGHILAIATGKSRLGLERALDHSGLRPFFQASRCADECHSKPHPQMLEELTAEFGIANGATVMIGDTSHDLLMASNAGRRTCRDLRGPSSRSLAGTPAGSLPAQRKGT
jgi:phosphoglycolate phosphatase